MRRCEDEKMFYRPPLLEEPCAQTLSGKNQDFYEKLFFFNQFFHKETRFFQHFFGISWHFVRVSPFPPWGRSSVLLTSSVML